MKREPTKDLRVVSYSIMYYEFLDRVLGLELPSTKDKSTGHRNYVLDGFSASAIHLYEVQGRLPK